MRNELRVWAGLVCVAGLIVLQAGCGSGGSSGGGTTNPTPKPTVSLSASPTTITVGDSAKLTWSSTNATSCTASGAWSGKEATSGSQAESPTKTSTYTLDCTGSGGSTSASATVTVNPAQFSASISPSSANATAGSTVTLTASVANAPSGATISYLWNSGGIGSFSAPNGSQVVFQTPTMLSANPDDVQVEVTAYAKTSTGTTDVIGKATIAVGTTSTRFISGFSPSEIDTVEGFIPVIMHGSGFASSDVVKISPNASALEQYVDSNDIRLTFGYGTDGGYWNPGSYAVKICASDGTGCSPVGYLSFGGFAGNLGGATSTEEYRLDPGTYQILKYNLSTGASDGSITDSQNPMTMWGTAFAVDNTGDNLITNAPGGGISVFNTQTGKWGHGYPAKTAAQVSGKNGLVSWSDPTNGEVGFFNPEDDSSTYFVMDTNAGTARAISMTAGCGGTSAWFFDEQGLQLMEDSVTLPSQLGAPAFTRIGSVDLSSGFSAASQINYEMFRRFVLTTDNACEAAVLAPVVTGTDANGLTTFKYMLAIVTSDGKTLTPLEFQGPNGNSEFLGSPYLTANVKLAVMAPAGNAVYVETQNVTDGSSALLKIAWAPVSSGSTTVVPTVTYLGTVSPSNGFFGTSMVMDPSGKFIDLGMRTGSLIRIPLN